MSWVHGWGSGGDPELNTVLRALQPLKARVYHERMHISAPSMLAQMAAAEASEKQAPVQTIVPPARVNVARRFMNWLRSWQR